MFDHYCEVNEEKSKIAQALALELSDTGLISYKHVDKSADALKLTELVKDEDLAVLDKKSMDPSWQRHVPKRKQQIPFYEDLRNYQPIGIVRPERKQAMHTLVEQLMLPHEQRLHLVLEREKEARAERERLQAQELARRKKEEELIRLKQL